MKKTQRRGLRKGKIEEEGGEKKRKERTREYYHLPPNETIFLQEAISQKIRGSNHSTAGNSERISRILFLQASVRMQRR